MDYHFQMVLFLQQNYIKKRPEFLLNKIKIHAKNWKNTQIPLILGELNSYRNILHAAKVASAICIIIKQTYGDNYLICNDYSIKICDLVLQIYKHNNILLYRKDNTFFDINTNLPVIYIDKTIGNENISSNIQGNCMKLKALGWNVKPFDSFHDYTL